MTEPLIDIRDISVGFTGKSGASLPVLRNIDLKVNAGECIGIVGESGSGKSTLALAAMGYLKRGLRLMEGSVAFQGQDMFARTPTELEQIRGGELALIPQNSGQSLTPTLRIGAQLVEALRLHADVPEAQYSAKVIELLGQVRLPDPAAIMTRFRMSCQAGSNNVRPLQWRWPENRRHCYWTSQLLVWMSRHRRIFSSCCVISRGIAVWPWSMSATIWARLRGSVTALW